MKVLILSILLFISLVCKSQAICTPTVVPVISYPPNTTNTGGGCGGFNVIQYLCGPNTIVYDTTSQAGCWSVYVDQNSTLFLKPLWVAYQEIWLKSTSTLTLKDGPSTIYVYAEAGAIINQPTGPHSYSLITYTCSSIIYPFINCATGLIEKNIESELEIFPNPSSSIIGLSDKQNQFNSSSINIENQLGQIVLTIPFSSQIDISNLTSGMYFLTLQNKTNKRTVKIIKQ